MKFITLITAAFVSAAAQEAAKSTSTIAPVTTTTTTKPKACADYKTCTGCNSVENCHYCAKKVMPSTTTTTTTTVTTKSEAGGKPSMMMDLGSLEQGKCQMKTEECKDGAAEILPKDPVCFMSECDDCVADGMVWMESDVAGKVSVTCVPPEACKVVPGAKCNTTCKKTDGGVTTLTAAAAGVLAASAVSLLF